MDVKDKMVLVTGSSSGIGSATALAFGEKGANGVLLLCQNDAVTGHVLVVDGGYLIG